MGLAGSKILRLCWSILRLCWPTLALCWPVLGPRPLARLVPPTPGLVASGRYAGGIAVIAVHIHWNQSGLPFLCAAVYRHHTTGFLFADEKAWHANF